MNKKPGLQENLVTFAFLTPFLLIFVLFLIFPIGYSFYLSFFEKYGGYELSDLRFVGLDNYIRLLGFHFEGLLPIPNDPEFWWSVLMTLYYGLLAIPAGILASLGLALLLNNKFAGKNLFRCAFFLPNVLDMLVVGIIWVMIYAPQYGVIALAVQTLGMDLGNTGFLGNPWTAMPAIVFALTLKSAGFGMILFLAALQNIPEEIYEAADLDGAGPWDKFHKLTLPLIQPVILFMVVTGSISALNAFTEIYAMTQGGPTVVVGNTALGATQLTGYYLYKTFDHGEYGYAAAISYVLLGLTFTLSLVHLKVFGGSNDSSS